MARIPLIQAKTSAAALTPASLPASPRATAAMLSATPANATSVMRGVAQDVQAIAGDVQQAAVDRVERDRKAELASAVASTDMAPVMQKVYDEAPDNGEGIGERAGSAYDEEINRVANGIKDESVRQAYINKMNLRKPAQVGSAYKEEFKRRDEYALMQVNNGLDALVNRVRSNPDAYDQSLEDGKALIEAATSGDGGARLSGADAAAMEKALSSQMAASRFDAMIQGATSADQLVMVEAELHGNVPNARNWSEVMTSKAFDAAADAVAKRRVQVAKRASATAASTLKSMDERNKDLVPIPLDELKAASSTVSNSGSTTQAYKLARITQDQEILRRSGKDGLQTLRERVRVLQGQGGNPVLPREVSTAVDNAVMAAPGSSVSASYLGHTYVKEYGGVQGGYGKRSELGGTATGAFQFTKDTWLGLMRDGVTAKRFGVETEGKSEQQLLDMRKDLEVSTKFALALAEKNKTYLERRLGRGVEDAELYLAHFLGAKGAADMLHAEAADPYASADDVLPEAAAANKPLFYAEDGNPLSVKQFIDKVSGSFLGGMTSAEFAEQDVYKRLLDRAETYVKAGRTLELARDLGSHEIRELTSDSGSFSDRGRDVRDVAEFHGVPLSKVKPVLPEELDGMVSTVQEGTATEVLQLMSNLQAMGPEVARNAYKQIGEVNGVFEFAAGLAYDAGSVYTARDVMRGAIRMRDNPDVKNLIGQSVEEVKVKFAEVAGGAFTGMNPRHRQQVQDAAIAHYVEATASAGGAATFDADRFEASIQAVSGGAFGEVRGVPTMAPIGTTADAMDAAIEVITDTDLVNLSDTKTPPVDMAGRTITAEEIRDEARFRSIGGGKYVLLMEDDRYAMSSTGPAARPYIMTLSAKAVEDMVSHTDGTEPQSFRRGKAADRANPRMSAIERYKAYYPDLKDEIEQDPEGFLLRKAPGLRLPPRPAQGD